MSAHDSLRPMDVGVLLHLMLHPGASYGELAEALGIGKSSAHSASARLKKSGLVSEVRKALHANGGPAREFLLFGAPYAFPPQRVPRARGIATGFSAPMFERDLAGPRDPIVWPSKLGQLLGSGLHPLVPGAANISFRDERLYEALALIDALRIGDAREREIARDRLSALLERYS